VEGSILDTETREQVATLYTYEIPYRCLLPQGVEGLLVASRAISSNHEADGDTRNQPACMVTGQAAGVAGARWPRAPGFCPARLIWPTCRRPCAGSGRSCVRVS
jgi:hypothetical protein